MVKTATLKDFVLLLCNVAIELHVGWATFPNVQIGFRADCPNVINIFNQHATIAIGYFELPQGECFELHYNSNGELSGIEVKDCFIRRN